MYESNFSLHLIMRPSVVLIFFSTCRLMKSERADAAVLASFDTPVPCGGIKHGDGVTACRAGSGSSSAGNTCTQCVSLAAARVWLSFVLA